MNIVESYKKLGLNMNASLEEVKKAHRVQIKLHHPDLFMNQPDERINAEEITKEINLAVEGIKAYLAKGVKIEPVSAVAEEVFTPFSQAAFYEYEDQSITILGCIVNSIGKTFNRVVNGSYKAGFLFAGILCFRVLKTESAGSFLDLNVLTDLFLTVSGF